MFSAASGPVYDSEGVISGAVFDSSEIKDIKSPRQGPHCNDVYANIKVLIYERSFILYCFELYFFKYVYLIKKINENTYNLPYKKL